jgi:alcohol dehydrogenase
MDLAKGLSVTLSGPPGAAREYRGMNHVHHVNLDCLLVPSTAGSGSEMTYTVALIDETTRVKLGINGDNVFPRYALLIPDFLLTAPNNVVIGSALDVLVHSSEALSSTSRNQFASPLAAAAISSVIEHLPAFCAARQRGLVPKLEAEALLLAAAQAGSAVMNSSGGMASAISYPVGTLFNVPHGFAGGIPLPYVMKIQEQEGFSLAPTLRLDSPFSDILFELYSRLGVPGSFASWGVSASDRDLVHSRVLSERQVGLLSDPVGADEEALKTVLHQVMP